MYDIFLICPVRSVTEEQRQKMAQYIAEIESSGLKVYYPPRDTNQKDAIGWRICKDNMNAIKNSKEIHIFWDKNSSGSLFDLGMAFSMNKRLKIVNIEDVSKTETKSFTNLIRYWNNL